MAFTSAVLNLPFSEFMAVTDEKAAVITVGLFAPLEIFATPFLGSAPWQLAQLAWYRAPPFGPEPGAGVGVGAGVGTATVGFNT